MANLGFEYIGKFYRIFLIFCTFEMLLNQQFKNSFLSLFQLLFVFISLSLFLIIGIIVFICFPETSARAEKAYFGLKGYKSRVAYFSSRRYS